MSTPWYETWFNSPYYPLLYEHRNEAEAQQFVNTFCQRWRQYRPPKIVLDLGCGAGRFAYQFAKVGYEVWGMDLSDYLLSLAKKYYQHPKLHFVKGDMRTFHFQKSFDIIGNFFTSFGYFKNDEENHLTLANIRQHLTPSGLFILDYLNLSYALKHLIPKETLVKNGLTFFIQRRKEGKRLLKIIEVQNQTYIEDVRAFSPDELCQLLSSHGFIVKEQWGNYNGEPFDLERSPRLILFANVAD